MQGINKMVFGKSWDNFIRGSSQKKEAEKNDGSGDFTEYKKYDGYYSMLEQMPLLLQEGYKPASLNQIAKLTLEGGLDFNSCYDSSSAIVYAGGAQDIFKLLSFSQAIEWLNPKTQLYFGGVPITQTEYESLDGKEFSGEDMILNEWLTKEQVLDHMGWLTLFSYDKDLLEQYVTEKIKLMRTGQGKKTKTMMFHFRNRGNNDNLPYLRSVRTDGLFGGNVVGGGHDFNYFSARIVGVRGD